MSVPLVSGGRNPFNARPMTPEERLQGQIALRLIVDSLVSGVSPTDVRRTYGNTSTDRQKHILNQMLSERLGRPANLSSMLTNDHFRDVITAIYPTVAAPAQAVDINDEEREWGREAQKKMRAEDKAWKRIASVWGQEGEHPDYMNMWK